jgi:four helix bundle protein
MAKIERFEELQSWQKARVLADYIHRLTLEDGFAKDYTLRNQILGAAGSIMHNIAEGFDSGSNAEFTRFLKIARRSASEVQSELYLAIDRNHITQDQMSKAYDLATECKRLINGMIGYLQKSGKSSTPRKLRDEIADNALAPNHELDDATETT